VPKEFPIIYKVAKHLRVLLAAYASAFIFLIRYLSKRASTKPKPKVRRQLATDGVDCSAPSSSEVTVVLTCCARPEKLRETLTSFIMTNTYPVAKYIIIEDGLCDRSEEIVSEVLNGQEFDYIRNVENLGQLKSIDVAYSRVRTDYVFHMEEDWAFVSGGFIERSLELLKSEERCLYLSLRAANDQQGHPVGRSSLNDAYLEYSPFWKGCWVGFGFNPSLRRMTDYHCLIGGASSYNSREIAIGIFYYLIGRRIFVLDYKEQPFVLHTGQDCSTEALFSKA